MSGEYSHSRALKTLLVIFFSLDLNFNGVFGGEGDVNDHLEKGKKLLMEGNLPEALMHYSMAVEKDPDNYLTYFKRAAVFLALGQSRRALPDLDKVIALKPDFHQAKSERASTLLKLGKVDDANADFKDLASVDGSVGETAMTQVELIEKLREYVPYADQLMEEGNWDEAIPLLSAAVEISPWDVSLREKRAQCFENAGQLQSAISDIKMTTKLVSDNTQAFLRASKLYYEMGEDEDSLKEIRECLKLDPDHKDCFPLYKKVKKLNKLLTAAQSLIDEQRYEEATGKLESSLNVEAEVGSFVIRIHLQFCHCYSKLKNYSEGMSWCNKLLEMDAESVDALCDRAELYISNEQYEEAIKDYQTAQEFNSESPKAKDGLKRAQNLLKQSQKRDYYKILGVKRSATTKQINKAYRKLAKEWHPDKYEGEDKEKAEKMFYDIAAAKEVLTDEEMRQKFDNGEDPLDPENQRSGGWPGGGQGPFGFPFGQGGFTFTFRHG